VRRFPVGLTHRRSPGCAPPRAVSHIFSERLRISIRCRSLHLVRLPCAVRRHECSWSRPAAEAAPAAVHRSLDPPRRHSSGRSTSPTGAAAVGELLPVEPRTFPIDARASPPRNATFSPVRRVQRNTGLYLRGDFLHGTRRQGTGLAATRWLVGMANRLARSYFAVRRAAAHAFRPVAVRSRGCASVGAVRPGSARRVSPPTRPSPLDLHTLSAHPRPRLECESWPRP
jgi:hypothetical protein